LRRLSPIKLLFGKIPDLRCRAAVLTFFIAGLLYLLCFKHVDNLGARTLPAFATITSCPSSFNNRLTHGECIPLSSAMRQRGMAANLACRALGVVPTFF
jgi:hypothetical protein